MINERRHFIRHPLEIPISYSIDISSESKICKTMNLSDFGISFLADQPLTENQTIVLELATHQHEFKIKAVVKWYQYSKADGKYWIGVRFLNQQEELRAQMVEQMCYIDAYRLRRIKQDKRPISYNEAAIEWLRFDSDNYFSQVSQSA